MAKKILSICCSLLLMACFSISQTYAAEPENKVESLQSSPEQKAVIDDSAREVNKLTDEEKSKPKDQLIQDFVSHVDYTSCLNYNYYTKSINEKGQNTLYLIHILTFNYNNYLKLAKKFDDFFSKIALNTVTKTLLDQETNKKLYYLSKNYQEIEKNLEILSKIDSDRTAYRLNKSYTQLPEWWFGVIANTTSINCYNFYEHEHDKDVSSNDIKQSLNTLKHRFKISFIAESDAKDAFDSELARNTEELNIGDNEMLAPVFTVNDGKPTCILYYKQKLNLPPDQTGTTKITGRYELTKVK